LETQQGKIKNNRNVPALAPPTVAKIKCETQQENNKKEISGGLFAEENHGRMWDKVFI
jgi:hypothetical protein